MWQRLKNAALFLLPQSKAKWRAFLVALLGGFLIWLFNALNKEYSTALSFPIDFNLQTDQELVVRSLPEQLRLEVSGSGWSLLGHSLGLQTEPLRIPIDDPTRTRYLTAGALRQEILNQLDKLDLIYVYDDSLLIDLQPRITRRFHLHAPDSGIVLESGYYLKESLLTSTDSVSVTGPADEVSALPDTLHVALPAEAQTEPFEVVVEVQELQDSRFMRTSPEQLRLSANVQPLRGLVREVVLLYDSMAINSQLPKGEARINWLLYADDAKNPEFVEQLDTFEVTLSAPNAQGRRRLILQNVPENVEGWELKPDSIDFLPTTEQQ